MSPPVGWNVIKRSGSACKHILLYFFLLILCCQPHKRLLQFFFPPNYPCLFVQLRPVPFNKITTNRKHSKEINMASSVLTINLASLRQLGNSASSHFTQSASLLSESGPVCFFFLSISTRWEWNWQIAQRKGSEKICWVSVASHSDNADTVVWPFSLNCCRTSDVNKLDSYFAFKPVLLSSSLKFSVGWIIIVQVRCRRLWTPKGNFMGKGSFFKGYKRAAIICSFYAWKLTTGL